MTALALLTGTAVLAVLVVLTAARWLGGAAARRTAIILLGWLIYVGILSASGVVSNPALKPPGALYIMLPMLVFLGFYGLVSKRAGADASALPLVLLTGAQLFRIGVESGLHQLWQQGLVPRLMTYEGGNVDILIGLSAPLMAWLLHNGKTSRGVMWFWNGLGVLALLNIIVRSVLTSPGPMHLLHSEVPNLAVGTFPYTYIAGFFAPLALFLHILSFRHLRSSSAEQRSNPKAQTNER